MRYKARVPDDETAALWGELEPVIGNLGFSLVELTVFRQGKRGSVSAQIRLIVTGGQGTAAKAGLGTEDLSRIHRTVLPRLELVMESRDLYVEVSSPGTDRVIKEGAEFRNYQGRQIKCWMTGANDWERGVLCGSDEEKILLKTEEGEKELMYETMAKARLNG